MGDKTPHWDFGVEFWDWDLCSRVREQTWINLNKAGLTSSIHLSRTQAASGIPSSIPGHPFIYGKLWKRRSFGIFRIFLVFLGKSPREFLLSPLHPARNSWGSFPWKIPAIPMWDKGWKTPTPQILAAGAVCKHLGKAGIMRGSVWREIPGNK